MEKYVFIIELLVTKNLEKIDKEVSVPRAQQLPLADYLGAAEGAADRQVELHEDDLVQAD